MQIRNLANVRYADPYGQVDPNSKDPSLANMIIADVTFANAPPALLPDAVNLLLSNDNAFIYFTFPARTRRTRPSTASRVVFLKNWAFPHTHPTLSIARCLWTAGAQTSFCRRAHLACR